jgi:hypothetical protein
MIWSLICDDRRRKDPQPSGQSVLAGIAGKDFTGTKQGVTAMDHEIDNEKPSSKEGGQVKVGDKVWVLCEVTGFDRRTGQVRVSGPYGGNFWTMTSECRPVEPANSPEIPDSSSDSMRAAFEAEMSKRYNWYQGYFSRNENRYFDSSVEMAWQAFQAGAKHQSSPLAPGPCMDGLQVGDAVRFVPPGHNRHGTQGVLKSIHHGPKNAYLFVSDCGQFHRYCTIAELERVDQADPIDIKGSMASLDGADTIQEGDLQWTDRDGNYRLCNFTIGMRVHEAIQRGKAHGEKWVFYRKFREAGE